MIPPAPDSKQYLTIYADGALLVGVPLLSILLVSWSLTASLRGSLILTAVLTSLLVHLLGSMLIAGVGTITAKPSSVRCHLLALFCSLISISTVFHCWFRS